VHHGGGRTPARPVTDLVDGRSVAGLRAWRYNKVRLDLRRQDCFHARARRGQ
jgi:hypothetical protein